MSNRLREILFPSEEQQTDQLKAILADFSEAKAMPESQTAKADKGKLQITLVPTQIVRDIAEVRMYGNKKYGSPDNWKEVEVERYRDALCRHLLAYIDDPESIDEESGIPHYKHIACNMAFICEMERWKKEGEIVVYPQNG